MQITAKDLFFSCNAAFTAILPNIIFLIIYGFADEILAISFSNEFHLQIFDLVNHDQFICFAQSWGIYFEGVDSWSRQLWSFDRDQIIAFLAIFNRRKYFSTFQVVDGIIYSSCLTQIDIQFCLLDKWIWNQCAKNDFILWGIVLIIPIVSLHIL